MTTGLVTVFGGSGFIGKYVVRSLVKQGWRVRVAMRRPHTGLDLKVIGNVGQVQLVQANMRFPSSVERAVEGSDAVVNLVSILFESGKQTFEAMHVDATHTLSAACQKHNIKNLVHISALGADTESESDYARTKGEAEDILRAAIPSVDILRPSIVFGPEDNFFNQFAGMTSLSPALPLFGGGQTCFQPIYAGDVADAVAACLATGTHGETYALGGPETYSYKELMQFILTTIDRKRLLLPLPWFAANMIGFFGELSGALPFIDPVLTRDQVKLLKIHNMMPEGMKTAKDLGIELETIESLVPSYLARYRHHGQFHEKQTG
ncbi:MAG: complex I NDUFA9 subunit family protein [Maricaulaceae bacterium]